MDGSPAAYCGQAEVLIERIIAERGVAAPVVVFVATDDQRGVDAVSRWRAAWQAARRGGPRLVVAMQQTATQKLNIGVRHVAAMTMVSESLKGGVDAVSKQRAEADAAWIDIALLVEARFLVGLVMSQFARVAADIGLARGTMKEAIAIDEGNVGRGDVFKVPNVWRVKYNVTRPRDS